MLAAACLADELQMTVNCEVRQRLPSVASSSLILFVRRTRVSSGHFRLLEPSADPSVDHSRALRASVAPLPRDWNRRSGRPGHTWLRTVESDLATLNRLSSSGESRSLEHARIGKVTSITRQATP